MNEDKNKNKQKKDRGGFLSGLPRFDGPPDYVGTGSGDREGRPGGKGKKGKHQPHLQSDKKVGSEEEIEQPGEAPPEAKVKKVPKPAKLRLRDLRLKYLGGLKTPSQASGPDTGKGKSPSIASGPDTGKGKSPSIAPTGAEKKGAPDTAPGAQASQPADGISDEESDQEEVSDTEQLDETTKIVLKGFHTVIAYESIQGQKSGRIKITDKFKEATLRKAKKEIKKKKLQSSQKQLLNQIHFVKLPGQISSVLDYELNSEYSTMASYLLGITDGQEDHLQGLAKAIHLISNFDFYKSNGTIDEGSKAETFVKIMLMKRAFGQNSVMDEKIANFISKSMNPKNNGKLGNYTQYWSLLFTGYDEAMANYLPKTFDALNDVSGQIADKEDEEVSNNPTRQQETKFMNQDDIKKLIKEAFTDQVYGKYPYSHKAGEEGEPAEDYAEDWKRFCLEMVQDKSKARAIAIAKLLIKDIELFEDVLDLAGQNQSIGSEILRKMEKTEKV